jgi:hypothetical protein
VKSEIEKPAIKKKTGVISDKGIKVTTKITKSAAKSARSKSAVKNSAKSKQSKSAVKLMSAKAKLAKSAQRSKSAIQKPAKIQESVIQKVKLQP